MRRIITSFGMCVACLTFMVLAGILGFALSWPGFNELMPLIMQPWRDMLYEPGSPLNAVLYAILILFPVFTFYVWILERRERSGDYTKSEAQGSVTITENAIRKFIRYVCIGIPGIEDLQVDVTRGSSGIQIQVGVKVDAPESWLHVKTELQRRIPEEIKKVIGEDAVQTLGIVCLDLTRNPHSSRADVSAKAPQPWSGARAAAEGKADISPAFDVTHL